MQSIESDSDQYEHSLSLSPDEDNLLDEDEYKLGHVLKVPKTTTYQTKQLVDWLNTEEIEVDQDYQRDIVWSEAKQMGLIDSIMRNYYIMPVMFKIVVSDDGSSEVKICIDGKQRLTSIQRFMTGEIPYQDPDTKQKLWYTDNSSIKAKNKKLLPEKYRTLFANKQIVCVEYVDLADNDERDVFQRVQLGMALTPSEKLQVISSPRADFVRKTINKNFGVESALASSLKWDRRRGNDFRAISQLMMVLEKWRDNPKELPKGIESASSIEKYLRQEEEFHSTIRKCVKETCNVYAQLASSTRYKQVFETVNGAKQKLSPVEFTFAAVLIARRFEKCSLGQLAAAIEGMRKNVRADHVDIRTNAKVCKTLLTYIKNLKSPVPDTLLTKSSKKRKHMSTAAATSEEEFEDEADDEDDLKTETQAKKRSNSSSPSRRQFRGIVGSSSANTAKQEAGRTIKRPRQSSSTTARVSSEDTHIKQDHFQSLGPFVSAMTAPGGSQNGLYQYIQPPFPGMVVPYMGMHGGYISSEFPHQGLSSEVVNAGNSTSLQPSIRYAHSL